MSLCNVIIVLHGNIWATKTVAKFHDAYFKGINYIFISMVFVTFRSIDMKIVYVAQTTSQLLSCTEERLFWISWHNGQVAVGRGRKMGRNIVMAYEEMNPFRLTALSVTTDGSNGTWRFPVSQVKQGSCLYYMCHRRI